MFFKVLLDFKDLPNLSNKTIDRKLKMRLVGLNNKCCLYCFYEGDCFIVSD